MTNVVDSIFKSPVFETDRMVIGQWHPQLAEYAHKIYGDAEVTRWIGGVTDDSVDSTRTRLERLIERNGQWPNCWGSWPTFLKDSRELAGAMLMKPLPDEHGNCTTDIEIGWHLGQSHWGQGYATEGGRKMIEIAFHDLGVSELSAVTNLDNVRSRNVALRLGMKHRGQTDAYYGRTLDLFKISRLEP